MNARAWIIRSVVLLGLLLAGCRRADPLELTVRADTPYEFMRWQERVMARQPESVALEFRESVARIVATSPTRMSLNDARMLHSEFHPICRQLDGRTVRQVIVTGYKEANAELLRGMVLDSDNLVALLKYDAQAMPEGNEAKRIEKMVDRRNAVLGAAKAQVDANRRRVAELERGAGQGQESFFVRFARWRVLMLILP